MTNQCAKPLRSNGFWILLQGKRASKKDERTTQTKEHFLSSQETLFKANCLVPFCAHIKSPESLELASVIPTWSLRRPSYLIYPLLFPSPKTGVSVGCRRCPLYTSEFC